MAINTLVFQLFSIPLLSACYYFGFTNTVHIFSDADQTCHDLFSVFLNLDPGLRELFSQTR